MPLWFALLNSDLKIGGQYEKLLFIIRLAKNEIAMIFKVIERNKVEL